MAELTSALSADPCRHLQVSGSPTVTGRKKYFIKLGFSFY